MSRPIRVFIFGLGYTGTRLAQAMRREADWVGGTVRTLNDALMLAGDGVRAFIFNGSDVGIGVTEALRQTTHLVITVPPGSADPVLAQHRKSVVEAVQLRWIGYFSTVGVYGDTAGAWVDETTPPHPATQRSVARLAAEQAWQALAEERGVPLAIFRVAGIYGPGRNALANLADGSAHRTVKPDQVFNRVHVDDLIEAISAALVRDAAGIFNVADDEPSPPQDVVSYAARLMGVTPPPEVPFAQAQLSPMARSFYGENKRVASGRIAAELGVALTYPTYREGLSALWNEGTWRGEPGGGVR